jgi:hypothetical protein
VNKSAGATAALLVTAASLLLPGAALADGPGYGGTADALTVDWADDSDAGTATADGLAVYAVGFEGGSRVTLRVGAAEDRTVDADTSGALRVLVVNSTEAGQAAPAAETTVLTVTDLATSALSAGTTVQAVGRTPAGTARTLIGAVPPPATGSSRPWWWLAGAGAAGIGALALVRRLRGQRPRPRHRSRWAGMLAGQG